MLRLSPKRLGRSSLAKAATKHGPSRGQPGTRESNPGLRFWRVHVRDPDGFESGFPRATSRPRAPVSAPALSPERQKLEVELSPKRPVVGEVVAGVDQEGIGIARIPQAAEDGVIEIERLNPGRLAGLGREDRQLVIVHGAAEARAAYRAGVLGSAQDLAAMKSNHPSMGLPRPAGFEDRMGDRVDAA